NAMRAHVALLQKFADTGREPRVPQQIQRLEQALMGLEELVTEYLPLESPEDNDWQEADPAVLVQEVLTFAALDLEQGRVTVERDFSPRELKVYVDRDKLKRAVLKRL